MKSVRVRETRHPCKQGFGAGRQCCIGGRRLSSQTAAIAMPGFSTPPRQQTEIVPSGRTRKSISKDMAGKLIQQE
eukprot:5457232-Amphidinium_carterae.1